MKSEITLVSGLWDIRREELIGFHRKFSHYLECFDKLLKLDFKFYLYVPADLIEFVTERSDLKSTFIHYKSLETIKSEFSLFDKVQEIRTNPNWYTLNGWLTESTQAQLEYYNPIVMSKMRFLSDATFNNPFKSEYLFWIDGGIANSVSPEFLKNLKNIKTYMQSIQNKFLMLSFDYESEYEVHGFEVKNFSRHCGIEKSKYVCRGGFFGGTPSNCIELNKEYDTILSETIEEGLMGTEENILTILSHKFPNKIHRYELPDSLVYSYFVDLSKM